MADAPLRILTVCTANVCRSPVAEHLLRSRLAAAGHDVVVRSAGTHGGLNEVHRHTYDAARTVDVDLTSHTSRPLDRDALATDGRDLIITMTREHLRHVVAIDPGTWPRTFTLKELVRRAANQPPGPMDFVTWRAALGEGRRAADLMRADPNDDVLDPYGGPASGHAAMVRELDELCTRLARLLPHPS